MVVVVEVFFIDFSQLFRAFFRQRQQQIRNVNMAVKHNVIYSVVAAEFHAIGAVESGNLKVLAVGGGVGVVAVNRAVGQAFHNTKQTAYFVVAFEWDWRVEVL